MKAGEILNQHSVKTLNMLKILFKSLTESNETLESRLHYAVYAPLTLLLVLQLDISFQTMHFLLRLKHQSSHLYQISKFQPSFQACCAFPL